jgi:hypothetical protein
MKQLLSIISAGIIMAACSNSGSNTQPADQIRPNEIIITNDMENAAGKIPSWAHERSVMSLKEMTAHSGEFVCVTNDTIEYSYTYSEQFKNINNGVPKSAIISGWVYSTVPSPLFSIILDIKENDKVHDWKAAQITDRLIEPGKWVEFNTTFYFDKPLNPEQKVSIYAWNQAKKPIYIDDLKISFNY